MAERWKTQDSARTMTQKYNSLVDEVNASALHRATTENTEIVIDDGLTDEEIDEILKGDKEV